MLHVLKEAVFVLVLAAIGCLVWEALQAIRPPASHSAGRANAYITDNPRYRRLMGPTAEEVQVIMEGNSDSVESDD